MNKMLMYDKYEDCYRTVVDVKRLEESIQNKIIEIKNEKVKDKFVTASQAKLDKIILLDNLLKEVEEDE